jgi:HTH-type transcriptional regulator/antitoxin HigA
LEFRLNAQLRDVTRHFSALSALVPLRPIRNARDYKAAVRVMDELLDAGATDESHALADLAATFGELIADYDAAHFVLPDVSGADALRFLMQQHGLRQSDLPEIGSQGVVSEVLHGKRELNPRQIRALSKRFHVGPGVFL